MSGHYTVDKTSVWLIAFMCVVFVGIIMALAGLLVRAYADHAYSKAACKTLIEHIYQPQLPLSGSADRV